jgi:predicted AAA+ superfamily ATPase
MKNLSLENLSLDMESFSITEHDSYLNTYQEFITYFKNIECIEKHHLVIASHFVYGWMPTVIQLKTKELKEVLTTLNAVKAGQLISLAELERIKFCINNSMVGASKLLHFISPKVYAIWDSRIFRYLTGKKSQYGIEKPENYLEYLRRLNEIANKDEYKKLHAKIQDKFLYEISPLRAIELLMFETDRERQRKTKLINIS